jgi:hypothetical protein
LPDQIHGGDFVRLLGLVRLARDPGDDRMELRTVKLDYSMVRAVGVALAPFASAIRVWSERESARGADFAAVVVGRRIASLPR